uniref:NADH-ubiquinone oxidoreductase chain 4L n=2 Tax=Epicauta TaxID=34673 RepID=A0A343A794_9CUCU|nr:NADH dehydrogenase subunit 4L [Epicauta gorhami]YP_010744251.1 NADH dehydrogenase subunit 4L [Epicauta obscurocephala]APB02748.1 NADH dehydrogenase subunit 4L [Epicauta gorhami]WET56776.1 NADH dehydrogenase subunit 4L [Epicauta obscurocephala]
MTMYTYSALMMFFCGFVMFSLMRKHLLLILLSIEFMVLALYLNMFSYLSLLGNDYFFSMIFLTFSVCEGSLGLSVLVSMIRSHGNDYFQGFNLLW